MRSIRKAMRQAGGGSFKYTGRRTLHLEPLESRLNPSLHTWTGGGGASSIVWSDPRNWNAAGPPAGDANADIVFPVVGTGGSYSSRDDLTALLPIHSVQFTSLGGVSLDAIAGLTLSLRARGMLQSSAGHNVFGIDLLLVDDPSGSPGDHTLQVDNSATQLDMVRGIAGSASENLVKSGTGTLTLNGVNKTYAGATVIMAGQ